MSVVSYVVITPARDEEKHLQKTVDSMVAQAVKPAAWMLINDGSTDATAQIADSAAAKHDWIKVVHRHDRGSRKAGSGVMDSFYDGYDRVGGLRWDFLVKLDADVSFEPDFFERCFEKFRHEPRLGIAGGTVCRLANGKLEPESKIDPAFHVRGAIKIYRAECWREIGGLIRAPGWDTVDELKANMLGWKTITFPDVLLLHHRPTGQAYGKFNDMVKGGHANYFAGYHPVFMLIKCMRRMFTRPYFIGGAGLLWGYLLAGLNRMPRVPDKALIKYFQREQLNRLLLRKSLWNPD